MLAGYPNMCLISLLQEKHAKMEVPNFNTVPKMHKAHQRQMPYTNVPELISAQTMGEILETVGRMAEVRRHQHTLIN